MRKVRSWEVWDWKSIIVTISVVSGLCIALSFIFHFPDLLRHQNGKILTNTTSGHFIRAEEVRVRSQGKMGTRSILTGVLIEYSYMVDGVTYYSKDNIPYSSANEAFLGKLSRDRAMILFVFYNPNHPDQSQIFTSVK